MVEGPGCALCAERLRARVRRGQAVRSARGSALPAGAGGAVRGRAGRFSWGQRCARPGCRAQSLSSSGCAMVNAASSGGEEMGPGAVGSRWGAGTQSAGGWCGRCGLCSAPRPRQRLRSGCRRLGGGGVSSVDAVYCSFKTIKYSCQQRDK